MKDKKNSYTAADNLPIKLMLDKDAISDEGLIRPIHAQFIPTNRCNLNCPFCSCSERDKKEEMSFEDCLEIIDNLAKLGCKAVTITGGGEPILHPHIEDIINAFIDKGIKVGLVSNGLLLHKVNPQVLNKITWCRISNGAHRRFTDDYKMKLSDIVKSCPNVDWAFSHVVTVQENNEEVARIISFANEHNFTHVRLVADLFDPEDINLDTIKQYLKNNGISDDLVIYQPRKEPKQGGDCYIGFLKPLIGADGMVYACCGVQYALKEPSRDLPKELCLGSAKKLDEIYLTSVSPLNGSKCVKCYYDTYNKVLKSMTSQIDHREFL